MHWLLVLVSVTVLQARAGFAPPGSCPPVCACKWKGGKQTVECVDRALITIPELVDPATQVLDLSGNNLQIIPREAFARTGLLNLQRVYLRNCHIGQIDDHAFKGLTNLVELDLSNNLLTHIPSLSFIDAPFLRDLSLAHNAIQKVHDEALNTLKSLVRLDLSKCEIREIASDAFKSVRALESLKLNGNDLRELPLGSLEKLERLRAIELSENPWTCNCRLRELKLWLAKSKLLSTPSCSAPSRLAGRPFADLSIDEFACKPEIVPISRNVEAGAGENATIACRTEAMPSANINWYWNGRLLLNGTSFGSHQKIFIFEDGLYKKRSSLVLTNVQESDSGEFYCGAENKGGSAEANFTLHVSTRAAGMASLGGAQIASLGAVLLLVALIVSLAILVMAVRLRSTPACESKSPSSIDCVVTGNGVQPATNDKVSCVAAIDHGRSSNVTEAKCNPVQKPPRMGEIAYTTNHYEGRGSVVVASGPLIVSPTISGNDPDIISDTRPDSVARPGSGDYAREGSESLYPSGLWEQTRRDQGTGIARAVSSALPAYYSDRTPIMDTCSVEGSQEELGYTSRTFPRAQAPEAPYPADYGLPTGGRVLRVWQRAPPVLPPVSALKRALGTNRSSPDEGYQEGCGTDV